MAGNLLLRTTAVKPARKSFQSRVGGFDLPHVRRTIVYMRPTAISPLPTKGHERLRWSNKELIYATFCLFMSTLPRSKLSVDYESAPNNTRSRIGLQNMSERKRGDNLEIRSRASGYGAMPTHGSTVDALR